MFRVIAQKYYPFTILFTAIISISGYTSLPLGNTYILWLLQVFILGSFLSINRLTFKNNESKRVIFFVKLYIVYNLICIIRGFFVAETYWDLKGLLNNGFALLLPLIALPSMNVNFVLILLRFYLRFTLPLLIFLIPFISNGAVGFFLVPISFLVLFFPIIKGKWKYMILVLSLFVVLLDLAARSNVIKFLLPILFSFMYYFRRSINLNVFKILRIILLAVPLLFLALAISGSFNIFKMNEYVEGDYSKESKNMITGEVYKEDLTADTRTIIYIEVLRTAEKYNTWIFGRSPARGNETEAFAESMLKVTGRKERLGNEVAILNIFTWTGIIGVALFFLVFYYTSYLAIYRSNNVFSKILGLYITFRWSYAWVEDINYFTLTTFMLWLTIGVTISPSIRKKSNQEFIFWVNSFFNKNIYHRYKIYLNNKLN